LVTPEILTRPTPEPDELLTWGPLPEQVADFFHGSARLPLVIFIHGGFWRPRTDRTHARHLADALSEAGYPCVSLEYRRVLGLPDFTMDDLRLAMEVVPGSLARHFDGRTVLMGHSAGSHLALWAASECPPAGLVAAIGLAPIPDLEAADEAHLGRDALRDFLGAPASARPDLDPARLPGPDCQTYLLAGAEDDEVPAHISEGYVRQSPGVEFSVLPGVDHYSFIDPTSEAWHMIVEKLDLVCQVRS
jgi:acetyl esterase/lipase